MKKIASFILVIAIAVMFYSCQQTPEAVVEKYFNDCINLNYSGVVDALDLDDGTLSEDQIKDAKDMFISSMKLTVDADDPLYPNKFNRVTQTTIRGNKAEVEVEYTLNNGEIFPKTIFLRKNSNNQWKIRLQQPGVF